MIKRILFFVLLFTFISCDKGLSPELASINPGFGGTITFLGNWDKEVTRTHIVLFQNPLLSKLDFNAFNLKYVSDSIDTETNIYEYNTNGTSLLANVKSGEYAYLAVAQSKSKELSLNREDWEIVGLYYSKNDSTNPGVLIVPEATFVEDINIVCDFNNPPQQPPGADSTNAKTISTVNFSNKNNEQK
ncbi:MAG: hypothetical protein V3V16_03030 [Melioribacteraceae bacterium]